MATATRARNTPAASAAAAVAGTKAKRAPVARSGTPGDMPDESAFRRYAEFMGDVITPPRARVLWRLSGGITPAPELATLLGKTPNAISGHLKHLRARGLIETTTEGRVTSYALTHEGEQWVERLRPCFEPFVGG